MAYALSNGHVTDDVTWPWKVKLVTPIRLERNISKTTWATDFKFGVQLCIGNAERAPSNFPWEWVWPRSRDPTIFGSKVGYPSDSLASCLLCHVPTASSVSSAANGNVEQVQIHLFRCIVSDQALACSDVMTLVNLWSKISFFFHLDCFSPDVISPLLWHSHSWMSWVS